MSIDANVVGIQTLPDGTRQLVLEQPDKSRCAGRSVLAVEEPAPSNLAILFDKPIWGGDSEIMCGEIKVGERIGYGVVRFDYDALIRVACAPVFHGEQDVRELLEWSK